MRPKVVEKARRYYKIEILPNFHVRVPKSDVKAVNGKVLLFKNPISRLTCVALFE